MYIHIPVGMSTDPIKYINRSEKSRVHFVKRLKKKVQGDY
jgi:hypothetical protein